MGSKLLQATRDGNFESVLVNAVLVNRQILVCRYPRVGRRLGAIVCDNFNLLWCASCSDAKNYTVPGVETDPEHAGRSLESGDGENGEAIRVYIPQRYLVVPGTAGLMGLSLGLMRGGRQASLQYLAENAHRQPRTVEGWYFYKKTKNYRVMWGALKEGGREATRLGAIGLVWAGLEDGIERLAASTKLETMEKAKEVGAGVGTGLVFGAVYRLPMASFRRAVVLGGVVGLAMAGLREIQRLSRGRIDGTV